VAGLEEEGKREVGDLARSTVVVERRDAVGERRWV